MRRKWSRCTRAQGQSADSLWQLVPCSKVLTVKTDIFDAWASLRLSGRCWCRCRRRCRGTVGGGRGGRRRGVGGDLQWCLCLCVLARGGRRLRGGRVWGRRAGEVHDRWGGSGRPRRDAGWLPGGVWNVVSVVRPREVLGAHGYITLHYNTLHYNTLHTLHTLHIHVYKHT